MSGYSNHLSNYQVKVLRTAAEIRGQISSFRDQNPSKSVGFVPTMGALHEGHLSLVKKAAQESDIVVVSIFVNPSQFNDPKDLEKYPRTEEKDLDLLKNVKCDLVFIPPVNEIYPDGQKKLAIDFGMLNTVMEGANRPGHFDGVAMVVNRLFDLVTPDIAFFGEKDFQQLAVIRKLVVEVGKSIKIQGVETVRSDRGLALSSRNQLLSEEQGEDALIIYNTLKYGQTLAQSEMEIDAIRELMIRKFTEGKLELEYLEVLDEKTFERSNSVDNNRVFIAAKCGNVRLIDNMKLKN